MSSITTDAIIIGGGCIGSAVAFGLTRLGAGVAVIDEGDVAFRAAHGNFGLVWLQGKGLGMPRYAEWCLEATQRWPGFAAGLEELTGIRLDYHKTGGFDLALSEAEKDFLVEEMEALQAQAQARGSEYEAEFLDHQGLQEMIPELELGPEVRGATFTPHDGHVNPLNMMKALHAGFQSSGGRYHPGCPVSGIAHDGSAFEVTTKVRSFRAPRLVLATGLGIPPLAKQVGLEIPVAPERGQLLVTERTRQILKYPLGGLRQTAEGSFMFGASHDDPGLDTRVTSPVIRKLAARAIATFPGLADLRIVRSWSALRPLTPDHNPIYEESGKYPGAFVLTSHSAVSLAGMHAEVIPGWILEGAAPRGFEVFGSGRFNVPAA